MENCFEILKFATSYFGEGITISLHEKESGSRYCCTLSLDYSEFNRLSVSASRIDALNLLNFGSVAFLGGRSINIVFAHNKLTWFKITQDSVISYERQIFELNEDNGEYGVTLLNPQPAKISDIYIPEKILEAYYASICVLPLIRPQQETDIVTFVEVSLDHPPIILPRWAVLKYCKHEFSNAQIVQHSIILDQKVSDNIMDMFEHCKKPKTLNKQQLLKFQEMFNYLTK